MNATFQGSSEDSLLVPSSVVLCNVCYDAASPSSGWLAPASLPTIWGPIWRRKWQPTPIFLPRESHGQRSLAGYNPWVRKESDTSEQRTLHFSFFYPHPHVYISVFLKSGYFTNKTYIKFNFYLLLLLPLKY